jgi:8-oxo-dGTP diphosphatase
MVEQIATLPTQIHCLSEGKVLLVKRTQPPNAGCWVAPGGKLEAGESPWECAYRKLGEETGLVAEALHMSGLVTLVIPQLPGLAFLFLFTVTDRLGDLIPAPPEGTLRWWTFEEASNLALPQANWVYLPRLLSSGDTFYQAKYSYDENIELSTVVEFS